MGFFKKKDEGFGAKLKKIFTLSKLDDKFYDELEDILIESDINSKIVYEIIDELKEASKKEKIDSFDSLKIKLKDTLAKIIYFKKLDFDETRLNVILVLGVNGVGKTTTIAKLAEFYKKKYGLDDIILVAGDTFRAAAIEQLDFHGEKLGVRVIKSKIGSDPASIIYDALDSAIAKKSKLVIIDTAGRMHTKEHLLRELEKIDKIVAGKKMDFLYQKILVIDGTTGQNGLTQAEAFSKDVKIDSIILTKYDSMVKGGNIISINKNLGIPISFIGVGEKYSDFIEFNLEDFLTRIIE